MTNEKRSGLDEITRMIAGPDNVWTTTPAKSMRISRVYAEDRRDEEATGLVEGYVHA